MRARLPNPGIRFRHGAYLVAIHQELAARRGYRYTDEGAWDGDIQALVPLEYQTQLKGQIDADLKVSAALTAERSPGEVGGPGVGVDFVQLVVVATALAGGYADWRAVADDLRSAIRRLRRISQDHVAIDSGAAVLLAVDSVAAPGTFATVDVRFVAPVRLPEAEYDDLERAFIVGLDVNGEFRMIVVDQDGQVVGISSGPTDFDFASLGL